MQKKKKGRREKGGRMKEEAREEEGSGGQSTDTENRNFYSGIHVTEFQFQFSQGRLYHWLKQSLSSLP